MADVKHQMKDHFLRYASYVILDRAIPNVVDGLKPVQRRILETLYRIHDEKLHKVANVVGQTMQLHPHGDAPIYESLVNLANKGFSLDRQGNFGNPLTGDPSAAARYIETRLSPLAKETLFNPDLTETVPSYDGRNQEPVVLPAKIPLLLMQGAEGIAVGMATSILPHNFQELLEAEIAYIEGNEYELKPDFPTGGILDASDYDKGRGKVKLRAKIEIADPKTLVIREICYGTTTEGLIRSIDEAAKRGKIKIDSINDYTAEKVEIEIKLPRGQYADELIDQLYGYTECQVSLSSQVIVIKDNLPWETDVHEILEYHANKLKEYLKRELEIEHNRLLEKIFAKSLEQIFIEERLYKQIETVKTLEGIHDAIEKAFKPYHKQLLRVPTHEDRERLLQIPIRKISRFDLDKSLKEVKTLEETLAQVEKDLKNIKKFTINYLKDLIKKYAKDYPRKTELQEIEAIDKRAIATRKLKVGFDQQGGFIGTKVAGETKLECTNYDKLLVFFKDGTYQVINIPEKQYLHNDGKKVVYVGVADKKTLFNLVYRDQGTNLSYVKRFIVDKFILDKSYTYLEPKSELMFISTDPEPKVELKYVPKAKQKTSKEVIDLSEFAIRKPATKGLKLSNRQVKKVDPVE
ncbi:MAG: DNA topoisomerase IV subunit A [Chlamydiia bacterium]|nr:DNA topoisomerase IV subunit A [Chlamydiia bacterium]